MNVIKKIEKDEKKRLAKRHKRNVIDFSFAHIKTAGVIGLLAIIALVLAATLYCSNPFLSSIAANIFAGLITGLVICLISGNKTIAIAQLENQKSFLTELAQKIKEFQTLYAELLKKSFVQFDGDKELFDFIYDVGCHASWINDFILQGSLDPMRSFNPLEYCKEMEYDAFSLVEAFDELHTNLHDIDIECPTKKQIIAYFDNIEKALRKLNSAVYYEQKRIDLQLEKIRYSVF